MSVISSISRATAGRAAQRWLEDFLQQAARDRRRDAARRGVGIYPANSCFTTRPSRPALLLGYSGLDEPAIHEGIRRLGAVMRVLERQQAKMERGRRAPRRPRSAWQYWTNRGARRS